MGALAPVIAAAPDPVPVPALAPAPALAPSLAAPDGTFFLEGDHDLLVHHHKLRRKSCNSDSDSELHNGSAVTCRGRCQVHDGVHRLLLEVPVVQVCGGVVHSTVGGNHLVLNREAPLSVGGSEK